MTEGVNRAFNPAALAAQRKERGWTQAQLAARSARSLKAVIAWESGARTPTPAHLLALATTLGVEPEKLIATPRGEWFLAELRSAAGLDRKTAGARMGMSVERLRHVESGINQLSAADAALMAKHYRSTATEVRACWQRANDTLTAE